MGNFLSNCSTNKEEEIKSLKREIEKLKSDIEILSNNSNKNKNNEIIEEENFKKSVNEIVEKMMQNNNINNSLIPDYIERQIYENIFTSIISLVKEILETTKISILNQEITLNLNHKT